MTGAEIPSVESSDQSLLLTLVAKASSHGSRILAIMFGSRDVRNAMLSGLRCVALLCFQDKAEVFMLKLIYFLRSFLSFSAEPSPPMPRWPRPARA